MTPDTTHSLHHELHATRTFLEQRLGIAGGRPGPRVGLILGSGLGGFASALDGAITVEYGEIPNFPVSTVTGHAGRLVAGACQGVPCVAMQGRVHPYEGHTAAVAAFPARALIALGARTLVITNAAGGLHDDWPPGTLMLIADHLNLTGDNPLRGGNDERVGPRFPDMSVAYDPALRALARAQAERLDIAVEEGIYAGLSGPSYETPAEIRMLSRLGADAVGMSTVFEVIAARHMGARVLGISCITNKAAGISPAPLSHAEVTETAALVRERFEALICAIVAAIGAAATASAEETP